jgi:hypothetical protein
MTDPDPIEAMREVAREVLREVVPEILAAAGGRHNGNGHAADRDPVPRVPAPPVAAVLRPSTWAGPAVPGEVIGDGVPGDPEGTVMRVNHQIGGQLASGAATAATDPGGARVEAVSIDNDEDLERFVRALLVRLESPREKRALRAGRIRFALRRAGGTSAAPGAPTARAAPAANAAEPLRIPKGAVTERVVRDAADRGVRLVLARGAVLTPLARDQARALGVEIEQEGRC